MSKLSRSVDACLNKMSAIGGTEKGAYGEKAVFTICEEFYQREGGILYHSYSYKTDPTKEGNIKRGDQGNLFIENLSGSTEIDVLLVTKNRVFPIEVKAYKAKEIVLTDDGISGCFKTDKSPVHQNEMHMRHLYPTIFRGLPDGETRYVVPVVVFVDKCKVIDKRSKEQKDYIKVITLNMLKKFIQDNNAPLEYAIDLRLMDKLLKEICISSEKYLPYRAV